MGGSEWVVLWRVLWELVELLQCCDIGMAHAWHALRSAAAIDTLFTQKPTTTRLH